MSKVTVQRIEATCDRCGAVGDTGNTEGRQQWGELEVIYIGHQGGRAWDGCAAGNNIKGKAWLCMACTDAFLKFMKGGAA